MLSVIARMDTLQFVGVVVPARDLAEVAMKFSIFLSSYFPDTTCSAKELFDDMLEQARLADQYGYCAVTLPEHNMVNILMNPAPLQTAVKVASQTKHIDIVTAVLVLPFHDMRRLAGEIAVADILCDGRVILGVGRGAFGYEFDRFGVTLEESREKFDESLDVMQKLLTEEEVSWAGKYYNFPATTIMPRPMTKPMPPLMIAALAPEAIYHCALRGFHVQTTPLQGSMELLRQQTDAFFRGVAGRGKAGQQQRLSLLRLGHVTNNDRDTREKLVLAQDYFKRFDNVLYNGPGIVKNGAIEPLPPKQTVEQLAENLLIGTASEIIDKLGAYDEAGIHEVNLNLNIGASQSETVETIQRFSEEIMPHFSTDEVVEDVA
jgi:alkanesulfonate monooxygenase SsuD/methylene tetrahydromethanopterin reductase-like flavin-dependent oxidoreductase (luciferase family)